MWRNQAVFEVLKFLDRKFGRNEDRFLAAQRDSFPNAGEIAESCLYVTQVNELKKWASFRCPGKCGKVVRLRLSSNETPRWECNIDCLGRATIEPSVRQLTECACHFWIKRGRVNWCPDSPLTFDD